MLNQEIEVPTILLEGAVLPFYASDLAAGADVRASLKEERIILPGKSALIPTGIKVAIPPGYEIQIRPRSGLAFNHQITVLNTPGTIDADYRGELGVILINHGLNPFKVSHGDRIAQLVLAQVVQARYVGREELSSTSRGGQGFGSTGV